MNKILKTSLILISISFLLLIGSPQQAQAQQWRAPVRFQLLAVPKDNQIVYHLQFRKRVDWSMLKLAISIPLPEGTRFVESQAIPVIDTGFNGTEVTFFMPVVDRRIDIGDAFFIVEIADPAKTVFTTQPWLTWQGEFPNDYLEDTVSVDITKPVLDWAPPGPSRLQLDARAVVEDEIITYFFYPKNVRGRLWDIKVNVPIPEGTTYVSAEAYPIFTTVFDGREVSFTAIELEQEADVGPLIVKVSTEGTTAPVISTHAWATWKNTSRQVIRNVPLQEDILTNELIVQPNVPQQVVYDDKVNDVPFANYDITGIALQEVAIPQNELALKLIFQTAGYVGLRDDPVTFNFYIDNDCQLNTGKREGDLGAEYRVRYRHGAGRTDLSVWNEDTEQWDRVRNLKLHAPVEGRSVATWVPYSLLENGRQFCWEAESLNRVGEFNDSLPSDTIPNNDANPKLTQYQALAGTGQVLAEEAAAFVEVEEPGVSKGTFIDFGAVWQYLPGWTEPPGNWATIGFDDSNWFSGPTEIGYGPGKQETDLSQVSPSTDSNFPSLVQHVDRQSGMVVVMLASGDEVPSLFMRHAFNVPDPTSLTRLQLTVRHEGGFIAYLNGEEVARVGLDESAAAVTYDTLAADSEAGILTNPIDLSLHRSKLVPGTNVLAIQAHRTVGGSNLSMNPSLSWVSDPADIVEEDASDAVETSAPAAPVITPAITMTPISGKLAIPIDNTRAGYDVHIFSLPDGQEIKTIPNARQPHFWDDGQRLLINREGGGVENLFEHNLLDGVEKQVSDAPRDSMPFYDPWGNRVVYYNSELIGGASSGYPFIFVQCSLLPPHQESEARCRDLPGFGVLIPAGQVGEIQGTHPVWTADDMIAFNACNTWAGSRSCGIYTVPSSSTRLSSDGFTPRQLTTDSSDLPTDTQGDWITFMSRRDGDWELYIMGLNGDGVRNLSNSPGSNDGLGAISPDGNWVAFVSDRDGQWAVWAVPLAGGSAQKLFNLPGNNPWGDRDRVWSNERISWGR